MPTAAGSALKASRRRPLRSIASATAVSPSTATHSSLFEMRLQVNERAVVGEV